MTTRVRHFHVKLGIALSSVAKEDTCRVRPSVGFGDFSLEKRSLCRNRMTSQLFALFKCKIVSFSSKAKPPSFSTRLKSTILHLQSPKNVHYYFIYGRLAFKQTLISINSNLIHNFLCDSHLGIKYIFI